MAMRCQYVLDLKIGDFIHKFVSIIHVHSSWTHKCHHTNDLPELSP
jgi:hypothetical protein